MVSTQICIFYLVKCAVKTDDVTKLHVLSTYTLFKLLMFYEIRTPTTNHQQQERVLKEHVRLKAKNKRNNRRQLTRYTNRGTLIINILFAFLFLQYETQHVEDELVSFRTRWKQEIEAQPKNTKQGAVPNTQVKGVEGQAEENIAKGFYIKGTQIELKGLLLVF